MEFFMKRMLYTLAAGVVALGLSATNPTGIVGTMHDLSATGPNTVTNVNEVCVFCHTPHAAAADQKIPLWNHTTAAPNYKMYESSATLKGVSAACLSCHDGTLAVGDLVNIPYANNTAINTNAKAISYSTAKGQVDTTSGKIVGSHNLGTDLTNDHPIGVPYNMLSDMQPVTNLQTANVPLFSATGDHTFVATDTVECASCHDVHNWGGGATAPTGAPAGTPVAGAPFLRVNNTGSALCLTCHNK